MYYVTPNKNFKKKEAPRNVFGNFDNIEFERYPKHGVTYTKELESADIIPNNEQKIIIYRRKLAIFEEKYKDLIDSDKQKMYTHTEIPKKDGGMRPICAPNPILKSAQKEIVKLLTNDFHMMHHVSAYGFIKNRSTKDMTNTHKYNNFFLYTDFADFFGHCKYSFIANNLAKVYPICEIIKDKDSKVLFNRVLSICFLNGSLPQGAPSSPAISNLAMIPIDFQMTKKFSAKKMRYSRYADNITVSAEEKFPKIKALHIIWEVLEANNAPFSTRKDKTYYRSIKGANWSLGMVTNAEHKVSIGYRKKNLFKAMTWNLAMKFAHFETPTEEECYKYLGYYSYFSYIDREKTMNIVNKVFRKCQIDVPYNAKHFINHGTPEWRAIRF